MFRVGTLPAVTLTRAPLEIVAAVTVGPARAVVPPEMVAVGMVLVLFSDTRPPETLSDAPPADARRRSHVAPDRRHVQGRQAAGRELTRALPEMVAAVTVGPARAVVPPEMVAVGMVLVLFIASKAPETLSDVLPTVAGAHGYAEGQIAAGDVQGRHVAAADIDDVAAGDVSGSPRCRR